LPPSITSHLSEIKFKQVLIIHHRLNLIYYKKSEKEEEFVESLNIILKILYTFNDEEQRYFKGVFFLGNSECSIS
jgi:hypothetical protein